NRAGPKRAGTPGSDPFSTFDIAPKTFASVSSLRLASALPLRLGFLDGFLVIPAAAAGGLVEAFREAIGGVGLGLLIATSAESRTAPGRELVDLRGPVIQTRIHCSSPCRRAALDQCAP